MRELERGASIAAEKAGCRMVGTEECKRHRRAIFELPDGQTRWITYSRRPKNVEEIVDNIGKTLRRMASEHPPAH